MQRHQPRQSIPACLLPSQATVIVDQIKWRAHGIRLLDGACDSRNLFLPAALQIVHLRSWLVGRNKLSSQPRSLGRCHPDVMSPPAHLAFYIQQHLFRAAATIVAQRQQRIGDIKNAQLAPHAESASPPRI